MTTLKELKKIPLKIRSAVFGYMRQTEKQLYLSTVPIMVYYLCLGYYFHGEYFEKAGNDLQISDDKMCVERITEPEKTERGAFMNTTWYIMDYWKSE